MKKFDIIADSKSVTVIDESGRQCLYIGPVDKIYNYGIVRKKTTVMMSSSRTDDFEDSYRLVKAYNAAFDLMKSKLD